MGYWQHRNVFPCCEYSVFSIFDVNDVLSKFDGFINLLDVGNEKSLIGSNSFFFAIQKFHVELHHNIHEPVDRQIDRVNSTGSTLDLSILSSC